MTGARPAETDPIVGQSVGNYVVERLLGTGAMGAVYLVRHRQLPQTVAALKVLRSHPHGMPMMKDRFIQEALVAAAVGSHRVVRPLDLGHLDDGTPWILMEFVVGRTLALEITAGPLPVETALKIAYRVADTMAIAHRQGIIHRDLKPTNIMILGEAAVKLLDFGVAQASGDIKVATTGESVVIGSPGYMSPEAATALPVDGRTDVFSLGATLYKMLTGELPFPAPTDWKGINDLLVQPAPTIASRRPAHLDAASPSVEALLASSLAKSREERPTMESLRDALAAALGELRPDEPLSIHAVRPDPADADPPLVLAGEDGLGSTISVGGGGGAVDLAQARAALQRFADSRAAPDSPLAPSSPSPSSSSPVTPRSARWRDRLLAVAVVAAIAAAIGAAAFRSGPTPAPVSAPRPGIEPVAAPPPVSAIPKIAPAPPATVESVAVELDAQPRSATTTLDGAPLPNPFAGRFPRSQVQRSLVVEAAGYRTQRRWLTFDRDQTVAVQLVRLTGSPRAGKPRDDLADPVAADANRRRLEAERPATRSAEPLPGGVINSVPF